MDSFHRYLRNLQGAFVQVDRTSPDACQGWLAFVQSDYLTLRSPEGYDLHLPLRHIHSVSQADPPGAAPPLASPQPPETFSELLAENLDQYVRVYHAGPDVTSGILCEHGEDHLVLRVSPDETICFSLFHLRSLYKTEPEFALLPVETQGPFQGR